MCHLGGSAALGEKGDTFRGPCVGGRSRLCLEFTFLAAHAPSPPLGILGDSLLSLGPRDPARRGSRHCGVGGTGWGAPTVRPADRCHFLLGFRASGECPGVGPRLGSCGGARPASPLAFSPNLDARGTPSPIQLSPGERQLRVIPKDETPAEAGRGPGIRAAPGPECAAPGAGPGVRMGRPHGSAPSLGGVCDWAPGGCGSAPGASAERAEPGASSSNPARWQGPGAAPAAGP